MQDNGFIIGETTRHFDALVVGSGVTGGWAAKEFTERGLKNAYGRARQECRT